MIDLLSSGKVSFTRADAMSALNLSPTAFQKAAKRQQLKHALLSPRQGFYVVIPPQRAVWGAPPASAYIDDLMRHENAPYYVGLLKAAELHGATHHAVMAFQVVTDKRLPMLRVGRSVIQFLYRKEMAAVSDAVVDQKTETGTMKVSSPELTAFDLVRYWYGVGSVDGIATVLVDLGQKINADKLAVLVPAFEQTVTQRLGYLLEAVGHVSHGHALHRMMERIGAPRWIELEPGQSSDPALRREVAEKNSRWHVLVRRIPEPDE